MLCSKISAQVTALKKNSSTNQQMEGGVSVAVCTKFLNKTMTISLDVPKELETNFMMRYARPKSEERPLNYSIFKKENL